MDNKGTVSEMIRSMMEKKKGDKDTFTMTGQYASPVMYDNETSREFVMYEAPNGEEVKVFGNWNEYAVSQDESGKDMIADEDYPIRKNENGEFVFDEVKFEQMMQREAPEPPRGRPQQGEMMPGEGMMPQEGMMPEEGMMGRGARMPEYNYGGKMKYNKGGKVFPDLTGDGRVTMADILRGRGVK